MMAKMDSNQATQDQRFTTQEQRFSRIEAQISEINVHRKMLESQISQIAQEVASSSSQPMNGKGKLPSQPQPNPRGECKSISTFNAECKCISIVEVEIEKECKELPLRSANTMSDPMRKEKSGDKKLKGDDKEIRKESKEEVSCEKSEDKNGDQNERVDEKKKVVENEGGDEKNESGESEKSKNGRSDEKKGDEKEKGKGKAHVSNDVYEPKLPFPQKHMKAKLDEQFGKFLEVLKNIYIDIPFVEAVRQMPNFVKFLKEFVIKRKCVEDCKVVNLSRELSDAIQNKLPPKLKDPGNFNIPTNVGRMYARKSLCDLGASVSLVSMSMVDKIGDGVLKPSNVALKLADESLRYPIGVLEDVKVKVGKFVVPVDLIVIDEKESEGMPVILGRPFLATAGANIDVQGGRITFRVNGDECEFKLPKNSDHPMELVKESLRVEISNKKDDKLEVDKKKKNEVKEAKMVKGEVVSSSMKEWKAKLPSQSELCAFSIKRVLPNGMLEVWNRDLGTRNIKLEDAKVFIGDKEGTSQPPPIPPNT
jgi:hypothetical protein